MTWRDLQVQPVSVSAAADAAALSDRLTKPRGALGQLESAGIQLAAIADAVPPAALIAALTGRPAEDVTGRGTGIDDQMLATKIEVVRRALARTGQRQTLATLASLGGLEIAALAGFVIGGAAAGVPVIIDGVIAGAALLVAAELIPECVGYAVPGHRSTEPGASAVLERLNLQPLLDLDLRLGEGSGACLALPVLQASAKILREMATFDGAGVTEK